MSIHNTEPITCPGCGKQHEFPIWQSINTTLNPEMKQAVRDGSAFRFHCPDCGHEAPVVYDFLYHQMEDNLMIQLSLTDEGAKEAEKAMKSIMDGSKTDIPASDVMSELMTKNGYIYRIVRSYPHLLEKVTIFDENLDDRIMELVKLFLMVRLREDRPEVKVDETLFFIASDGKWNIQLLDNGNPIGAVTIERGMYEAVSKNYEPRLPDLLRDRHFTVDQYWAMDFLCSAQ